MRTKILALFALVSIGCDTPENLRATSGDTANETLRIVQNISDRQYTLDAFKKELSDKETELHECKLSLEGHCSISTVNLNSNMVNVDVPKPIAPDSAVPGDPTAVSESKTSYILTNSIFYTASAYSEQDYEKIAGFIRDKMSDCPTEIRIFMRDSPIRIGHAE